ncbi:MAG: CvpA family protein [Herpetosiphon sp.]
MTATDILLVFVFFITVGIGFFQGTIKLAISLITFYASVVLASLYFQFLAVLFTRRGTVTVVANGISFFLILFAAFVLLLLAGVYTFRYLRLPGRLDLLDRVLGTLLAVVLGLLVTGILAMVLNYIFVVNDPSATADLPVTTMLENSVRASGIRAILVRNLLPTLYASVAPLLPDAAQSLFNPSQFTR